MSLADAMKLVRASINTISSLEDLMRLIKATPDDIIGQGSTATTIAISPDYVIRFLNHPSDFDPWFDGFGKHCLRKGGLSLLPRVYSIFRTNSVGIAFMERVVEVGTLLEKLQEILPSIHDDSDIDHLFDNMALYFSNDREKYQIGKQNLEDLTGITDPKELATVLAGIESSVGFRIEEIASLYFKITPSLGIEDGEVDVRNAGVGWRRDSKELVIFDPVA